MIFPFLLLKIPVNKLHGESGYDLTRLNTIVGRRENKYSAPHRVYKLKVVTFIYFLGVHVFKMQRNLWHRKFFLPWLCRLHGLPPSGKKRRYNIFAVVKTGKTHFLLRIKAVWHESVTTVRTYVTVLCIIVLYYVYQFVPFSFCEIMTCKLLSYTVHRPFGKHVLS